MDHPNRPRPHKFVPVTNGTSSYDTGAVCEYCGVVAFWANWGRKHAASQEGKVKAGCPLAPEPGALRALQEG